MSEHVRIEKSELEQLQEMASTLSDVDVKEMKTRLDQLAAKHEEQRKNIGRPGFLYQSQDEYQEAKAAREHTAAFLKAAGQKDTNTLDALRRDNPEFYAEKANFNTGTDAQGGYIVPDAWETEIMNSADKFGYAARLFRNYPMSTQTVNLQNGGDVTGYEVSETGNPTTTDSSSFFSRVQLTAKRFAAGYIASNVELEDAIPAFQTYMAEEIGRGLAKRIDQTAFKGDISGASNHFDGITVVSGTNTVTMGAGDTAFSNISWTDLIDLEAAVGDADLDGAVFVMPRAVFNYLRKELDSNNRPIWSNERPVDFAKQVGLDALGSAVQPSIGGYPVVVTPDSLFASSGTDTACAVFGDFGRYAYYGIRRGLTIKPYTERWNGVDLGHSTAFEGSARIGVAFNDPAAFSVLKTNT